MKKAMKRNVGAKFCTDFGEILYRFLPFDFGKVACFLLMKTRKIIVKRLI